MGFFLLLGGQVVGVAVGVPPRMRDMPPLSLTDWLVVIGLLGISFYGSVRLVTWLQVKISSLELFHEIKRELGNKRERRHREDRDR